MNERREPDANAVQRERQRKLLARLRLYHFTDTRNLASIRENGGISSLARCERLGINIAVPGGDENSQHSDRTNGMDAYVHLCLRNEHPMEYSARSQGRIVKSTFIPIKLNVLELDGVRFVPGMSNTRGITTYSLDEAIRGEHLQEMDLDVLYKWTDWYTNDNYQRRVRAEKFEIIVPDFIPLDLITLPNG